MKIVIFTLLVLSIFFVIACAPKIPQGCTDDAKVCPDGSAVGRDGPDCQFAPCPEPFAQEQSPPEPELEEPEVPEMPVEPEQTLPEEISAAFDKAKTKTTSYSYMFKGPESSAYWKVYVKGDLMKVQLPEDDDRIVDLGYDTVYTDLQANTAMAYCEREQYSCDLFPKGEAKEVSADDYLFKTPFEWIDEITQGELAGSETVDKREAYRLEYTVDGLLYTVLIDKFSGMVVYVKIGQDTSSMTDDLEIYEYKDLGWNTVEDATMEPPTA